MSDDEVVKGFKFKLSKGHGVAQDRHILELGDKL